jgi:hypothetical protein
MKTEQLTQQVAAQSELEFESVVAIFQLLRAGQQIDSHMDALSDMITHPATGCGLYLFTVHSPLQ